MHLRPCTRAPFPPAAQQATEDGGQAYQLQLNLTCHHDSHDDAVLALADVAVGADGDIQAREGASSLLAALPGTAS